MHQKHTCCPGRRVMAMDSPVRDDSSIFIGSPSPTNCITYNTCIPMTHNMMLLAQLTKAKQSITCRSGHPDSNAHTLLPLRMHQTSARHGCTWPYPCISRYDIASLQSNQVAWDELSCLHIFPLAIPLAHGGGCCKGLHTW